MTKEEWIKAYIDLYEEINAVPSDEMTNRELRIANDYWPTYIAAMQEYGE